MNLKKKTRLIASILALSLMTSGCGHTTRDEAITNVEQLMEEYDFYKEERASESNEEFYGKFYNAYLDTFMDYMSNKQYRDFKDIVKAVPELEKYDYDSIITRLNNMICGNQDRGYGIYTAFNTRFLYEELHQATDLENPMYKDINTIRSLINDDEAFYDALFSRKIEKLEKLMIERLGADEEDVKNLIDLYDAYYSSISSVYYVPNEKEELETKINETMSNIIKAKMASDESFKETFYARMLKWSKYFGLSDVEITENLAGNKVTITLSDLKGTVSFDCDIKYLYSKDLELWELKYIIANNYIEEAYNNRKKENKESVAMELLSFLLSSECSLENTTNAEEVRCELYKDLSAYFDSSDDFADFIIRLFNRREYALNRYFEIFEDRIKENGIEMLDFLRYEGLRGLVKKHEINTYIYDSTDYYKTNEEIAGMLASDAEKYVQNSKTNYQFYIDYDEYFKEIDSILEDNDLGISRIVNDSIEFQWWKKPVTISNSTLTSVMISEPLTLKCMEFNGASVYYYEAPKGFEEGTLSKVFYNINGDLVIKEYPGLEARIEDPETGNSIFITAVGINKQPYIDEEVELKFVNPFPIYTYDCIASEDEKKLLR